MASQCIEPDMVAVTPPRLPTGNRKTAASVFAASSAGPSTNAPAERFTGSEKEIGRAIIGAAIKVHSVLGPGLLESAYETCLLYELEKRNLSGRRQVLIPIRYEDLTIDNGYRIDLLVGLLSS